MKHRLLTTTFLALLLVSVWPHTSHAQTVISVGFEEIYDDNVFLESGDKLPPREVLEQTIPAEELDKLLSPQNDGKLNDDLISHPSISVSGAIPLSKYFRTAAGGKLGAYVFSSESDLSRLALDSNVSLSAEESVIPNPFYLSLSSAFASGSSDIGVAEGTASRQSQTHDATLGFGLSSYEVLSQTDVSLGYSFNRHDFLGEWTFSNEGDSNNDRLDENGADYFSNTISGNITHHATKRLDLSLNQGFSILSFSNSASNTVDGREKDALDRTEWNSSVGANYEVSDQVHAGATAGLNHTDATNTSSNTGTGTIINADGSVSTVNIPVDGTEDTFVFGANINYTPDLATALAFGASQSRAIDISGDPLTVRSFTANASRVFGERYQINAGGRYVQFDTTDNLSNAADRYETTLSLRYSITEALALSIGYNYTKQDTTTEVQQALFGSTGYESNRVFIGIDGGLVGTRG